MFPKRWFSFNIAHEGRKPSLIIWDCAFSNNWFAFSLYHNQCIALVLTWLSFVSCVTIIIPNVSYCMIFRGSLTWAITDFIQTVEPLFVKKLIFLKIIYNYFLINYILIFSWLAGTWCLTSHSELCRVLLDIIIAKKNQKSKWILGITLEAIEVQLLKQQPSIVL